MRTGRQAAAWPEESLGLCGPPRVTCRRRSAVRSGLLPSACVPSRNQKDCTPLPSACGSSARSSVDSGTNGGARSVPRCASGAQGLLVGEAGRGRKGCPARSWGVPSKPRLPRVRRSTHAVGTELSSCTLSGWPSSAAGTSVSLEKLCRQPPSASRSSLPW